MRYINIPNISFTRIDGKSYQIKDFREYPSYVKKMTYAVKENDMIDEIITRRDLLGDNSESESYKLVDFNITRLYENGWDLGKLKNIDVPDMI